MVKTKFSNDNDFAYSTCVWISVLSVRLSVCCSIYLVLKSFWRLPAETFVEVMLLSLSNGHFFPRICGTKLSILSLSGRLAAGIHSEI